MIKPQALARKSLVAMAALRTVDVRRARRGQLKVGLIATLSGPPAVLGQQVRDGFTLAVKTLGGKLGGREPRSSSPTTNSSPTSRSTKVKALIERDKVDFVVGPIFSNILRRSRSRSPRRTSS